MAKNKGTSKVNLGAGGIISASKGSAKIKEILMPDPGGIIKASEGMKKIRKGK